MHTLLLAVFTCLALYAPQAMSGPYEDGGVAHYDRERLSTYIEETTKAADNGDAVAQFNLAYIYARGFGVSQDHIKALRWFRKSAEQGLPRAQNYLGLAYIEARGGVSQNYTEAAKWIRKSAEQGDAEGAYLLAGLYSRGLVLPHSYSKAIQWYQQAAEKNHAFAQLSLGLTYSEGRGVEVNKALAYMWFALSAENGGGLAREFGRELSQTMSQDEIRQAEEMRSKWLAKHLSLEEAYIATRDSFIRQFAKSEQPVNDRSALAELEKQMRTIVGPVRIEEFSGQGNINLLTLKTESGYAQVDGLRFDSKHETLFVTTQGLFKHYLSEHPELPQALIAISKDEDFYRRVFHADAGIMHYAEVPVEHADGQSLAQAFLGVSGQDVGPFIPNEIFAFVSKGKQIRLINTPSSVVIADIPQCKSKWDTSRAKADDALARYRASQSQDKQAYDAFRRYEDEGLAAYRDCFARKAKRQPWFNSLKNQAQSLVNTLQKE